MLFESLPLTTGALSPLVMRCFKRLRRKHAMHTADAASSKPTVSPVMYCCEGCLELGDCPCRRAREGNHEHRQTGIDGQE